jgi:hypothetical protein
MRLCLLDLRLPDEILSGLQMSGPAFSIARSAIDFWLWA